ncbi:MAG: hypothetical protein QNJ01_05780 [Desulfobacterales bacterium]|nr:hypothetical protein [Desulfobacterales bacterium]
MRIVFILFIFFRVKENEPKETARAPLTLRVSQPFFEAAPHAAMRRCPLRSGAHNQSIAARLASMDALPDSMMLASTSGCCERVSRERAALKQAREPNPLDTSMLGAGQREVRKPKDTNRFQAPFERAT